MGRVPYKYNDVFSKSLLPLITSRYVAEYAGSPCWAISHEKIPFGVTLSGLKLTTNTSIKFFVEYYDNFDGFIRLDYDNNGVETSANLATCVQSNSWKIAIQTVTCRINSLFSADSAADFRLYASSGVSADKVLRIRRVGLLYEGQGLIATWQTVGLEPVTRESFAIMSQNTAINDTTISSTSLWSSQKIATMIENSSSNVAINDTITATDAVWSSSKTSTTITETVSSMNETITTSVANIINDEVSDTTHTWSGSKIQSAITSSGGSSIDDTGTSTTTTWSSSKIQTALNSIGTATAATQTVVVGNPSINANGIASNLSINIPNLNNNFTGNSVVLHALIGRFGKGTSQNIIEFYNGDYPSFPYLSISIDGNPNFDSYLNTIWIKCCNPTTGTDQYTLSEVTFNNESKYLQSYPLTHLGVVITNENPSKLYLIVNEVISNPYSISFNLVTNMIYSNNTTNQCIVGRNFEGEIYYIAFHENTFVIPGTYPTAYYTIPTKSQLLLGNRSTTVPFLFYDMQKRFNDQTVLFEMTGTNRYQYGGFNTNANMMQYGQNLTLLPAGSFQAATFPYFS